jgi:hypothetical protein
MGGTALLAGLGVAFWLVTLAAPGVAGQKKDYLNELEAYQIRDAETVSERVKLFAGFADDRLRKIDYELQRTPKSKQWAERVESLINAYAGCVDDAADVLEAGLQRQENLRPGLKELERRTKEFLPRLQQLKENPQLAKMQDVLNDAIEATREAAETAAKVAKEISAAPERRKP